MSFQWKLSCLIHVIFQDLSLLPNFRAPAANMRQPHFCCGVPSSAVLYLVAYSSLLFISVSLALPIEPKFSPILRSMHVERINSMGKSLKLRGGSDLNSTVNGVTDTPGTLDRNDLSQTVTTTLNTSCSPGDGTLAENAAECEGSQQPDLAETLEKGRTLKEEGNALHTAEQFREAAAKYHAARLILHSRRSDSLAASLEQSCALNLASCHLKLRDWGAAETACTDVLAMDHSNFKALYRRGIARLSMVTSPHTAPSALSGDEALRTNATELRASDGDSGGGGDEETEQRPARTAQRTLELALGDLTGAWAASPLDPAVAAAVDELRAAMAAHGMHERVAELDAAAAPLGAFGAFGGGGGGGGESGWVGAADAGEARLKAAAARLKSDPAALRAAVAALRTARPATLAAYLRAHPIPGAGQHCGGPGRDAR